jgi:hypothetical protein
MTAGGKMLSTGSTLQHHGLDGKALLQLVWRHAS